MDMSSITGVAGGMFMTLMKVVLIILVAVICFFGTRFYAKRRKFLRNFRINALISNPDGSHMKCRIGKVKDKDGMQKMLFLHEVPMVFFGFKVWEVWKEESMPVIDPKNIVSLSVHLFRYGPSQYSVIPPTIYRNIDIKKFNIQMINMHMLEFKGLEQRAGISRWAAIKKSLQEWAPWITLGIIALCGGVSLYFLIKLGMVEFAKVTAARVAECKGLIGGGSAPLS